MGMTVKLDLPPVTVAVDAVRRRAMIEAALPVLAAAIAGAPIEPKPRHGEHLRDTALPPKITLLDSVEAVELAFGAFWAVWQETDDRYHHPNGGHAHFLEMAMLEGRTAWLEGVAALIREGLTA